MGPGPQQPLPQAGGGGRADRYVALLSGLALGEEAGEPARVALAVDYLAGLLGSRPEQEQVAQVRAHHACLLCGRGCLLCSTVRHKSIV